MPLRVAIVKPDWRIRGGFELVVDRLVEHLTTHGHYVDMLTFDASHTDRRPFGVRVSATEWDRCPLFFGYLAQVEASRAVTAARADLVISTQPPSFVVDHPRHLSIFYHHIRPYYELSDVFIRSTMVDEHMHLATTSAVRQIDADAIGRVRHVMAGSETVAGRLRAYNDRTDRLSVFHAGPNSPPPVEIAPFGSGHHALCVSRHDFPKRTELFVHAAALAAGVQCESVGTGGRLGYLRRLAGEFALGGAPPSMTAEELWLAPHPYIDPDSVHVVSSNLRLAGAVSDDELGHLYRDAFCVVAPALLEDYGLTVIEAMSHGKPVIVCSDGGHLCHFVQHEVNGLVVEPTGPAIAAAMRLLDDDRVLAARLGEAARDTASTFTWQRALCEFDDALEMTMS